MVDSFNTLAKDYTTERLRKRRNELYDKLGFNYYLNNELDTNKVYVLLDSHTLGYMKFVKLKESKRSVNLTVSDSQKLAHTSALLPFDNLVGTEVSLKSDDQVFKGRVSYPCLLDKNNNMFCCVYWHQGQKNVPTGWVNVNLLNF